MSGPKHIRPSQPCCYILSQRTFKHLYLAFYSKQYFIPRGLPAIVSIINLSSCLCVASGETLMGGVHSICGPWPRNSNLVTVEQGTFHHSSPLPAISMDFHKIKKKQSNWHHLPDCPAMTSQRGEQPDTAPRPGIVLPTHRQPLPRYHIHQFVVISPLAFPNHHLYNLLPLDTRPRNGGPVQPIPQGEHDQTKWRSAKSN